MRLHHDDAKAGIRICRLGSVLGACVSDPAAPARLLDVEADRASGVAIIDSAESRAQLATSRAEYVPPAQALGNLTPFGDKVISVPLGGVWAVAVRNDGLVAVTTLGIGKVTFFDIQTKAVLGSVATETNPSSVAFSSDGKRLYVGNQVSSTNHGSVDIIDPDLRQKLSVIETPGPGRPFAVLPSPDGEFILSGCPLVRCSR